MRRFTSRLLLAALTTGAIIFAPSSEAIARHATVALKQKETPTMCERANSLRKAVVKKHGKRAPGRDICRQGINTKNGVKKPSLRQKASYLRALKKLNYASPMLGAGDPTVPPAGTATPRVVGGALAAIRSCESGGDYGAVDASGTYRGAYQFDYGTWQSVGGTGDPAAASPAEQDKRAAILYAERGSAPWPVCGR